MGGGCLSPAGGGVPLIKAGRGRNKKKTEVERLEELKYILPLPLTAACRPAKAGRQSFPRFYKPIKLLPQKNLFMQLLLLIDYEA